MNERVYKAQFDLLPVGSSYPDVYQVVLIGSGDGSAPQIPEISWYVLRDRLEANLAWTPEQLDKYEARLKEVGRLMDVPIEANLTQLRALGFQGV